MNALQGKVAMVSAAGRGIGQGIAQALARAGANVVVNSFSADTTANTLPCYIKRAAVKELTRQPQQ